MDEIEGVLKLNPVPSVLPPEAVLNQLTVDEEEAVNATIPGPQCCPLVRTGADGGDVIIACTATRELLQLSPVST